MAEPLARFSLEGDTLPSDGVAVRFEAVEAVSEPYAIEVELVTTDASFRVEDCLRNRVCLVVSDASGGSRLFDGVVDGARFVRVKNELRHFALRLRPALASLAHREGCRIFQEQSVVDIVRKILDEAGIAARVEWRTAKEYAPREFVVQYRESHLDFISRLLEEHGLFYFFRHEAAGHTLIIADDAAAFAAEEDVAPVAFRLGAGTGGAQPLAAFSRTRALRTSAVHLRDYDFERPNTPPEARQPGKEAWAMPYYEYPGGFTKGSVAAGIAEARMRSLRADADTCRGKSHAAGLRVGVPFSVEGAAEPSLEGEFVVTHLVTRGNQTQEGGKQNYAVENEFRAIPAGAPFAAPRRAKKPRIRGVQTAVVTGPSKQAEAIHVDKYGRIKVRFHWDRENQENDTSSCWVRVSQALTSGSMILPRVGWEVAVAFLDGDPDRPLVLGRVYNAEKTPPLALPANKTSGSLKSMSSPGGAGHNEISAGDGAGGQGLSIHAQKDLNVTIGHDKIEDVAVDEQHEITVNGSSTVKVDQSTSIAGNQSLDVGAVLSHKVAGSQTVTVGGNDTSNATANYDEKIGGNRAYSVGGNQITISNGIRYEVSGDFTRNVGAVQLTGSIGSINDHIVGALDETVGAVKVQLAAGNHGEEVGTSKSETYALAELHLTKGGLAQTAGGSVTHLVGGLHYQQLAGDYVVQAPMITLLGAVGNFTGGGSQLKLGGGPVVIKGPKIAVKGALIVKMSASMKLGS